MNIGVVNPYPVHANAAGGVTRVNALVRHLTERHRVTVFAHASSDADANQRAVSELRSAGVEQLLYPLPRPSAADRIRWMSNDVPYYVHRNRNPPLEEAVAAHDRRRPFDIVHVEFAYLWPLLETLSDRSALVLAEQETMSVAVERLAGLGWRRRTPYEQFMVSQARKVQAFDRATLKRFDRVFAITPIEAARIWELSGRRDGIVPHVVCTRRFAPAAEQDVNGPLLFVGNYAHRPNVVAAEWFASEVWPRALALVPAARCWLVGPGLAPREANRLQRLGMTICGRVGDPVASYHAASVFLNPITSGGGMRGKVLEAFACGLPVVSTTMGMEGIAATSGHHYTAADSPEAFAQAVARYSHDTTLARRHGAAARELVMANYDTKIVFAALEAQYERAVHEKAFNSGRRATA